MKSFNQLNNIFRNQIIDLYKTNEGKKIIAKYSKFIKENDILREQYNLFTQLEEGVSEDFKANNKLVEEYVNYIPTLFEKYSKKQISEANEKLYIFLKENNIYDPDLYKKLLFKDGEYRTDHTDDELTSGLIRVMLANHETPLIDTEEEYIKRQNSKKYWNEKRKEWDEKHPEDPIFPDSIISYSQNENKIIKAAEYIIYEGKSNLETYIKHKDCLINELKSKDNIEKDKRTLYEILSEFNEKYDGKLTNEELSIVRGLILSTDINKNKEMLKEYQKSCIIDLNKVLQECSDVDIKERLLSLKEQILFEDNDNINESIIKLSEIKSIINEIK